MDSLIQTSGCSFGSRHMMTSSRREFLVRGFQWGGLLGLTLRPSWCRADESDRAAELAAKAVTFLRSRQSADGSWSSNRKEPGITALVVTALLRSRRVDAGRPGGHEGAWLSRAIPRSQGRSCRRPPTPTTRRRSRSWRFTRPTRDGRYDRVIKGGQEFLKTMQWDEGEGKGATAPSTAARATAGPTAGPTCRTPRS